MKKVLICTLLLLVMAAPCVVDAAALSGKITQWTRGQETTLSGATILVGTDIWLDTSSSYDVVKGGKVVGKAVTDSNGRYTIDVPPGQYYMIIWKANYIPSDRNKITVPGTYNDSISRDDQVGSGGRHMGLRYN